MRIQWQKFLAVGALSALGALVGCQVEVIEGPPGAGGSGGTGGTAGTGGAKADAAQPETGTSDAPSADGPGSDVASDTGGGDSAADTSSPDVPTTADALPDRGDTSPPDGATGDTVSTDGATADAAPDASGGCFAEDPNDGGTNFTCANLPYYGTTCRDDGGIDGPSAGESLCTTLDTDLKATALLELFDCLKILPGGDGGMDACSPAHEQGSADCSRSIFNRSMCPVPDSVVEGGLYGCAQIAASCGPDSGAGGIPVALCQAWLGPFKATTRQGIIDCYVDPAPTGATSCRDKFENYCVFQ